MARSDCDVKYRNVIQLHWPRGSPYLSKQQKELGKVKAVKCHRWRGLGSRMHRMSDSSEPKESEVLELLLLQDVSMTLRSRRGDAS